MNKIVTLIIAFGASAFADSITPTTFTATIPTVGGSVTVNKTVTITPQLTVPLDILFLVDTTGSMSGSIASVRAGFASIVSMISGVAPDVKFGLAEYKDFGQGDPFTFRSDANIGSTTVAVQNALNALSASGGGSFDTPEAGFYGLQQAATTTSFRSGSQRLIIWVGDAPSHDPAGPTNVTEAQAIAALNAAGVNVFAASPDSGPTLDGVCDSAPLCTANQAKRVTAQTSGADLGTFNPAAISAAIQNSITTALSSYSTISLQGVGLPSGITAGFSSPVTGTYDRSISRTFNFTATFTGTAVGTYAFNVQALLDGRVVATEADDITVGNTPEPSTYLLFSSGLGFLALVRRRVS